MPFFVAFLAGWASSAWAAAFFMPFFMALVLARSTGSAEKDSHPGVLNNDKSSSKPTGRKQIYAHRPPSSATSKGPTTNMSFYIFGPVPAGSGGPEGTQGPSVGVSATAGAPRKPQGPTTTQTNKQKTMSQTESIEQSSKGQKNKKTDEPVDMVNHSFCVPSRRPSLPSSSLP